MRIEDPELAQIHANFIPGLDYDRSAGVTVVALDAFAGFCEGMFASLAGGGALRQSAEMEAAGRGRSRAANHFGGLARALRMV